MKINKLHPYFVYFLIFGITFIIYFLTSPKNTPYDYFVRLADAFLNHRLYLIDNPSWLSELIPIADKYYVVYPPMPAVMLIPFVAIFGTGLSQTIFSIFLGSFNPIILYSIFKKIKISSKTAFLTIIFFVFGTDYWFLSSVGSSWYLAHIVAIFFLLLAIRETFTKQRLIIIGLLLGASYWSRPATIFAFPFFLLYLNDKFLPINKKSIYNLISFGLSISFFIFLNSLYDFLRFSNINPVSPYWNALVSQKSLNLKDGLLNIKHIPSQLSAMFLSLPLFQKEWPYIIPSLYSLAIWFTSPAIVLIFKAKKSILMVSLWFAIIPIFFVISLWKFSGYSQFGFRYAQDFMPFALILVALGIGQKPKFFAYLLVFLSIIVNFWGIIMINFLNIWTM